MPRLPAAEFGAVHHLVSGVESEKALVQTVLSGRGDAEVFVEARESPEVALLAYNNAAILVGAPGSPRLHAFLSEVQRERAPRRFSHITCPNREWRDALRALPGASFDCSERIWYRFNKPAGAATPLRPGEGLEGGFVLEKIDHHLASLIHEQFGVPFSSAWPSPATFVEEGLGYCVSGSGTIASTAFSYFPVRDTLEIQTITRPELRGRGLAMAVNSKLIEECLARRIEPLWSCRSENAGSNRLALKLGFEYDHTYYWLHEKQRGFRGRLKRLLSRLTG